MLVFTFCPCILRVSPALSHNNNSEVPKMQKKPQADPQRPFSTKPESYIMFLLLLVFCAHQACPLKVKFSLPWNHRFKTCFHVSFPDFANGKRESLSHGSWHNARILFISSKASDPFTVCKSCVCAFNIRYSSPVFVPSERQTARLSLAKNVYKEYKSLKCSWQLNCLEFSPGEKKNKMKGRESLL